MLNAINYLDVLIGVYNNNLLIDLIDTQITTINLSVRVNPHAVLPDFAVSFNDKFLIKRMHPGIDLD
jgi:hypothetical protein